MELRIREEELEIVRLDGGGMPILSYNGILFTGTLVKFSSEGYLAFEREYIDGFEEGWFRSFFKNGNKKCEYKSHNNLTIEGTYKEWDENGNLLVSF